MEPLALAAGVMVFAYLVLTSLYLQTMLASATRWKLFEPQIQQGLVADTKCVRSARTKTR